MKNNLSFVVNFNKKRNELKVEATFLIETEMESDGSFVCSAEAFNTFAYGSTKAEAMENLKYAIGDMIELLLSGGRLNLFKRMKKLGWKYNEDFKNVDKFTSKLVDPSVAQIQNYNSTILNVGNYE